jgi:predicted nicotinamide N-methyase
MRALGGCARLRPALSANFGWKHGQLEIRHASQQAASLSPVVPLDRRDKASVRRFVLANTFALATPLVPEIRLRLAEESLPIWQKTEDELQQTNLPPPYWAFAWAGGQALARFVLDNAGLTAGRRVLDIGSGSGLVGIAACMAGAADVLAADLDDFAEVAIQLNAAENGVALRTTTDDLLARDPAQCVSAFDVLLVGDLFYEHELALSVWRLVEASVAAGRHVLVGDPARSYFPRDRFESVAEYSVKTTRQLEDNEIKKTAVWRPK